MEQSRRVAITGVAALIPRRRTDTYRLDNVFSNKLQVTAGPECGRPQLPARKNMDYFYQQRSRKRSKQRASGKLGQSTNKYFHSFKDKVIHTV